MKTIEMFGGQAHGKNFKVPDDQRQCYRPDHTGDRYDVFDDFAMSHGGVRPKTSGIYSIESRAPGETEWVCITMRSMTLNEALELVACNDWDGQRATRVKFVR